MERRLFIGRRAASIAVLLHDSRRLIYPTSNLARYLARILSRAQQSMKRIICGCSASYLSKYFNPARSNSTKVYSVKEYH
jgi:hypothetical protein